MTLHRWFSRLAFASMLALWAACSSGGDSTDVEDTGPLTEGEGGAAGEGGDTGESGQGGSTTGGKGGSGGKAGSGGTAAGSGGAAAGTAGAGSFPATGGGGAGGSAPPAGALGAKCSASTDCDSKQCVEVGNSKSTNQVCTQACDTSKPCPAGFHCGNLDKVGPVCVPDRDSQCATCTGDTDCKNQGDKCVVGPTQSYCAQDCSVDGNCPAGYECKAPPNALQGIKVCTVLSGTECPCGPNRDKSTRPCFKKVDDKSCQGTETCNGAAASYEGCSAPDPAPEVCDEKDNDCDGKTDNVPNASCNCNGGSCAVQCLPGFSRYPANAPESEGCSCIADPGEPDKGGKCSTALNLTEITDSVGKTSISISGTLSSDDDVDWYKINIKDAPENNANAYHAKISFDSNPDNEFVFTALRDDCTKEVSAPTLTVFEVCGNFTEGNKGKGQAPCATAPDDNNPINKCQNLGATYIVGVKRSPAAKAKTCSKYTLKFEGAAGPCDTKSFDSCGEQFGPALQQ